MLIVFCQNIYTYIANYLKINIRYLLAQSTGHEIPLLIVSQVEMKPIIITVIIILVLLHIGRKNS